MEKEIYTTKNLNIAAFLYACGLQLVKTDRVHGEVFFSFSPAEKAEQFVGSYFNGSARVNPRELFARLNDLKDVPGIR